MVQIWFFNISLLVLSINGFAPSLRYFQSKPTLSLHATLLDGKEIRGPITPLSNYVLVQTKDTLSMTGGGICLPDQVKLFQMIQAQVSFMRSCLLNIDITFTTLTFFHYCNIPIFQPYIE